MRIKKININHIISFVMLVVAGLVAINIYKGQNKKIIQIRQIQTEQREKNEILLRIEDLKKKIELYKETFKTKDRREIINTIMNHAAVTGVKIISLKPLETQWGMRIESKIYNKTFFNLIIQVDSYHQLGKFISRLEMDPMMFIIESLKVGEVLTVTTYLGTRPRELRVELIISELFFKD